MKNFIILLSVGCLLLLINSNINASTKFSVSVGMPISYNISKFDPRDNLMETKDNPSGFMLQMNFPFYFGVGIEKYSQFITQKNYDGYDFVMENRIIDLNGVLSINYVDISLGLGVGESQLSCSSDYCKTFASSFDYKFEKAILTQINLKIDFLIIRDLFGPYVSYHKIYSNSKGKIIYKYEGKNYEAEWDPAGVVVAIGFVLAF